MRIIQPIRRYCAITLCLCILATPIVYVPYLSYATTQEKLDETNQKIEDIESQVAQLGDDLNNFNSRLAQISNTLSNIDTQIATTEDEIEAMTASLAELEASETEQYEAMKKRIQYMYEHGTDSALEILLASQSLGDLLVRSEYIQKISQYDRDMLVKLQETYATEAEYTATLEADKSQLVTLKAQALEQQESLSSVVASTQNKIDTSTQDIADAEAQAKAYEVQLENERIEAERIQREKEAEEARLAALAAAANGTTVPTNNSTNVINTTPISYDASDVAMLAAIIECEAGGEPYEGKIAVGSVVVNRVNSTRYPNTIAGVLYQNKQFSPVGSGRFAIVLARGANSSCYQAANEVLGGRINVAALYFHVVRADDVEGTVIGNHIFY